MGYRWGIVVSGGGCVGIMGGTWAKLIPAAFMRAIFAEKQEYICTVLVVCGGNLAMLEVFGIWSLPGQMQIFHSGIIMIIELT